MIAWTNDAPWIADALCAEVDTDLFFPHKGGDINTPMSICMRCDVRESCLDYAIQHPELEGIWGGTGAQRRRNLRRAAREHNSGTLNAEPDHDAA